MKKWFIAALLLLVCSRLVAADNPEITLFAGWRLLPHWDVVYPYGRHPPYCWPYAGVGVGVPLCQPVDGRGQYYGYYGDPWWGFGYGVSYSLTEPRYAGQVTGDISWPLPGSAPLKLRDPYRERAWGEEMSELLERWDSEAWLNSATNRAKAVD